MSIRGNGTFAVAVLASCLAMLTGANAPAWAQHAMATPGGELRAELPPGEDSIRLPLVTSGEHIILPISVNGSEPLSVILDTGMPMDGLVLFDTEEVQALELSYSDMMAQVGGAGGDGKHTQAKIVMGATMNLASATFSDTMVLVMPALKHFSVGHAGIVGAAIFNNFAVSIDYDGGEIILTRPEAFAPKAGACGRAPGAQGQPALRPGHHGRG